MFLPIYLVYDKLLCYDGPQQLSMIWKHAPLTKQKQSQCENINNDLFSFSNMNLFINFMAP